MKKYRTIKDQNKEKMYFLEEVEGKEYYLRKGKYHDIIDIYSNHETRDSWSAKHQIMRFLKGNPNKEIPNSVIRKAIMGFEDRHINEDYQLYNF